MTLWLLDTNIISQVVREPLGTVALKVKATPDQDICTSIVVACELRCGAEKRDSVPLRKWIETILRDLKVQPLSEDADRHYACLRCQLESKGTPIGNHDMLIAAHALALDATLVTANIREFARIDGLRLENWLA